MLQAYLPPHGERQSPKVAKNRTIFLSDIYFLNHTFLGNMKRPGRQNRTPFLSQSDKKVEKDLSNSSTLAQAEYS